MSSTSFPYRPEAVALQSETPCAADPAALVALVYAQADPPARARMIETLMRPLGALALVAVAGGAFAALRQRNGWAALQVTLEDTVRVSANQVQDLAAYLMQSAPDALLQVVDVVTDSPVALPSLSVLLLVQAVRRMRRGPAAMVRRLRGVH